MTTPSPTRAVFAVGLIAAATTLAGCVKPTPPLVKSGTPDVLVERPTVRPVTDYEDFTGRTEAYRAVNIVPQVTGKLTVLHFKDGQFVSAGDPLFDIDEHLFAAQRDGARANLQLATAEKAKTSSVIAADEYAKSEAEYKAAVATEQVARFDLEKAETTLSYTRIRAEYTGRISRRMVDRGNIVKENETVLTRLVVLDPIYVSFDVDERTVIWFRKQIAAGRLASSRDARLDVLVGLADEDGYSRSATLTFADNQLDLNTGTLRMRAEMYNPSLQFGPLPGVVGAAAALAVEQKGLKLLSPGMFVRVRLPVGKEHPGLMIPEEALGSDQGLRFVYVLDPEDKAVYRRVKLGPQIKVQVGAQEKTYQVIDEGLSPTDRVIVSGLQRVRPGLKVKPKNSGQKPVGSGQSDAGPQTASAKK
jgi:multidrug efflux system membrane fusion protein